MKLLSALIATTALLAATADAAPQGFLAAVSKFGSATAEGAGRAARGAGGAMARNPGKTAIGAGVLGLGIAAVTHKEKGEVPAADSGGLTPEAEKAFEKDMAALPKHEESAVEKPAAAVQPAAPAAPAVAKEPASREPKQATGVPAGFPVAPAKQRAALTEPRSDGTQVLQLKEQPRRATPQTPRPATQVQARNNAAAVKPAAGSATNQAPPAPQAKPWGGEPTANPFAKMPGVKPVPQPQA